MSKKKFTNRELSWLDFNYRILAEAVNEENPLLERGKFLSIVSSNLDEFFMVRVGSLCRSLEEGSGKKDPSGMSCEEQLEAVRQKVRQQVDRQYAVLQQKYLPLLAREGIHFLSPDMLDNEQREWIRDWFQNQLQPLLTPWAINAQRPFPLLAAKTLHLAVLLPPAARGGSLRFAVVSVPSGLKRAVLFPSGIGRARAMLLEDVLSMHLNLVFGAQPLCFAAFRLTRNADFLYNDSDAELLISEMRKNLKRRKWGKVVRLEVSRGADPRLLMRLKKYLCVTDAETVSVPGPLDLTYFMKEVSSFEGFDSLRFAPFTPGMEERFAPENSIFDAIRQGDCLMHHPYDSFDPVVRFVCEAADDPDVMAIKQTLYRVSGKSPIVAALARAARQGKQVTVLIEVRARFDEENNINWCLELEKAGCHVYYGMAKLKIHSKITLVLRQEEGALRSYVHLGTGNYNDSTAKLYTDMGLFTCDEIIGRDAGSFFNMITLYGSETPMEKLICAPYSLRTQVQSLIRYEIKNAKEGLPASISAKMNSLCDPRIISLLYDAADAGVEVRLIVRGICCMERGKRKNLHIRSIVGRFLEHARIFVFHHGGEDLTYLASADWMPRNLDKRVELMFPVEDADLKARVIATLRDEWRDDMKAWDMRKSGKYRRAERIPPLLNVQEARILSPAQPEDLAPPLNDDDIESIDRLDHLDSSAGTDEEEFDDGGFDPEDEAFTTEHDVFSLDGEDTPQPSDPESPT